jgi:NADH dehydrogenase [ubiquinone] 1 alpha subcomplex assembly factor 7
MSVAQYMTLCLHDPSAGYYATRPGIGRDFTTAPETSQVFGELLGAWVLHEWRAMGAPDPFWLLELGPGRGVMMADMLRAAGKDTSFRRAVRLAVAEASPTLASEQKERIGAFGPLSVRDVHDLPPGPVIVVANEYLDCLPVRQAVRTDAGWRERCVGLNPAGDLVWGMGAPFQLPADMSPSGEVAEIAPAIETLVRQLSLRFPASGGRALLIDYGPADACPGDTLRAYRAGRQVDPLEAPGESDLTADVDFGRLARLARAAGLCVSGPVSQGAFLMQLGLQQRVDALVAADPARAADVFARARRLVDPADMGERFKAICIAPGGVPVPPGFHTDAPA